MEAYGGLRGPGGVYGTLGGLMGSWGSYGGTLGGFMGFWGFAGFMGFLWGCGGTKGGLWDLGGVYGVVGPPVFEQRGLRDLIVGHRAAEGGDLLQDEIPDLPHRLRGRYGVGGYGV